jgi:hypothetical protein
LHIRVVLIESLFSASSSSKSNQVKPALGVEEEELKRYLRGGFINYGAEFNHLLESCMLVLGPNMEYIRTLDLASCTAFRYHRCRILDITWNMHSFTIASFARSNPDRAGSQQSAHTVAVGASARYALHCVDADALVSVLLLPQLLWTLSHVSLCVAD